MQLLSSFGKEGTTLGLSTMSVDIEDTLYLSKYFNLVEFPSTLTAGKNAVSFNGSLLLQNNSNINVECLDSNGNSLYIESTSIPNQFSSVAQFCISIHVYNETYNGPAKLTLVGTTTNGKVVRWNGNITIDKTASNTSKSRFKGTPSLEVNSVIYPLVNTNSQIISPFNFTGSGYTIACSPPADTLSQHINPSITPIDYRVYLTLPSNYTKSIVNDTNCFNSQMIGRTIAITASMLNAPFGGGPSAVTTSGLFTITNVIDDHTLQLNQPFFYTTANNQTAVVNIINANFEITFPFVPYITGSDTYQTLNPISQSQIILTQAYAEVVYKNINTFTGYIARHKIYSNSLLTQGTPSVVVDEPIVATNLLIDPITANQSYNNMGKFYNQYHINKYWFVGTGSVPLTITASSTPMIDAMTIAGPSGRWTDGNSYVILKSHLSGSNNDAIYYPFDKQEYYNTSGSGYTSNFVALKSNTLYLLSFNAIVNKNPLLNSAVSFYLTSSNPNLYQEPNYDSQYGLLLGELNVTDPVSTKTFGQTQQFYFRTQGDYYGTLVIVPYNCNITLSNLSLINYGDYGFSPDSVVTRFPFPISSPNEGFSFSSNLIDGNSVVINPNISTVQSIDPAGSSLVNASTYGSATSSLTYISSSLIISQSLYMPNLDTAISESIRLVAWNLPLNTPPSNLDGKLCHTNIDRLQINSTGTGTSQVGDYLTLGTVSTISGSSVESVASALSIKYDGTLGRKIIILSNGTKTTYP